MSHRPPEKYPVAQLTGSPAGTSASISCAFLPLGNLLPFLEARLTWHTAWFVMAVISVSFAWRVVLTLAQRVIEIPLPGGKKLFFKKE